MTGWKPVSVTSLILFAFITDLKHEVTIMTDSVTRRDFLATTVAAAATASSMTTGLQSFVSAQDKNMPDQLPIIDTHQHLWDLTKFKLPWHKGDDTKPLQRSFVMSDYLEATKGLNVVKTVYMEVDVEPDQQMAEADYVTDLCKRDDNPMAAAVVSGRPGTPGFEPYIRRLARFCTVIRIRLNSACNQSSSKVFSCLGNSVKVLTFAYDLLKWSTLRSWLANVPRPGSSSTIAVT